MAGVQFITLIRLPFARGDFVDPPQADWDATKDRALWKVISKSSRTSDLNWAELAARFQVPQTFLLQQAAWLYERHLDHVRTQMKKVGSVNAPAASGAGSSQNVSGGYPMQRLGSGGSRASRAPSALSNRPKDSPTIKPEASSPVPAPLSRTPSTNTITQSRVFPPSASSRGQVSRPARPSFSGMRPAPPQPRSSENVASPLGTESPEGSALSSSSSSSSESDLEGPAHRSQLFKRPPRFTKQKPRELMSYDEDPDEADDAERSDNVLLPFAQTAPRGAGGADTGKARETSGTPRGHETSMRRVASTRSESVDVSSSLASSASDVPKPSQTGPGPLSPRHRAELAKLSPRSRGKSKREGSEGTPSMGSSFSDIDDASISQSALEEALLSNIQHGRMSTLSQLRSRYL